MADSIKDLRKDLDKLRDKVRLQEKQAKCEHFELKVSISKSGTLFADATCATCGKKFKRPPLVATKYDRITKKLFSLFE